MKKQQIFLIGGGILLLVIILLFGNTVPPKKPVTQSPSTTQQPDIDIKSILSTSKQKLNPSQQSYVSQLESAVVRGNVKDQQIAVYRQLAAFWRDSAHALLPYAWYTAEAAKLENSEKNLTFAAHFLLDGVRSQEDPSLKRWMAIQAKELFEKALQLNPSNDSSKVGLGSCYLFGNISETPMEGINMIRKVAEEKPDNMYAHMMLGIGSLISGQYDRAIERLSTVTAAQPSNLEAVIMLAEAYERKGDKKNAITWYEKSMPLLKNPEIVKEIDHRISELKK